MRSFVISASAVVRDTLSGNVFMLTGVISWIIGRRRRRRR